MPSIFPDLLTYHLLAPFFLRLILGAVFIAHGHPKLFKSGAKSVEFFNSQGIKPAKFLVIVVGVVEFFGGILLIIGLFTQVVAALLAFIMFVAIVRTKLKSGFVGGYEFNLTLMIIALSLMFLGAGFFAIDKPF